MPPALTPLLERYREIYQKYEPADARYLTNHRGHLMFLRPEEHEVCTADLIRTVTFTETKPVLQERIRELRRRGLHRLLDPHPPRPPRDAGGVGGGVRGRVVLDRAVAHFEKRLVKKPLTACPNPMAPSRALPHAVFAEGSAAFPASCTFSPLYFAPSTTV